MIDKWCAEQCGIAVKQLVQQEGDDRVFLRITNYNNHDLLGTTLWTIQDPRCREIVREVLQLSTYYLDHGEWKCSESYYADNKVGLVASGDTIAEAEIACITAIYEARDE